MSELTHSRVREVLDYDPQTGIFTWKTMLAHRRKAGTTAGSKLPHGYTEIGLDNVSYLAHRLAWFWMTGEWPDGQVDHIDLDRSNNAWSNLRVATHRQNVYNSSLRRNNTSGHKGVIRRKYAWHARIMANRKLHLLGDFKTKEEAIEAYQDAAKRLHGEFVKFD
jgi:hypothetical protein